MFEWELQQQSNTQLLLDQVVLQLSHMLVGGLRLRGECFCLHNDAIVNQEIHPAEADAVIFIVLHNTVFGIAVDVPVRELRLQGLVVCGLEESVAQLTVDLLRALKNVPQTWLVLQCQCHKL
jgi:hypothetical protein